MIYSSARDLQECDLRVTGGSRGASLLKTLRVLLLPTTLLRPTTTASTQLDRTTLFIATNTRYSFLQQFSTP